MPTAEKIPEHRKPLPKPNSDFYQFAETLSGDDDIVDWPSAPAVRDPTYKAQPHSVIVLIAHPSGFSV